MRYRARLLEAKLKEYLGFFSVVGLTGPRQSGKSTLLLHTLRQKYRYVSFDEHENVEQFYADPKRFMGIYDDRVIFDEVQKVPEIFDYIKTAVDKDRQQPGKFILTGSSQFHLLTKVTESLAGRIGLLTLLPYQYSEMPVGLREESVFLGGYPELVEKKYSLFEDWFATYISTYVERDVRTLSNIGNMLDFQRLIRLLAANTAQELNMSRFASDLGVDIKTIKHWLSILEASYVIFSLPPYFKNYGKRVVKRPKIYFYDTGLVSFFIGINSKKTFEQSLLKGPVFENYIVSEVLKRELHARTHAELYYLRTSNAEEIDLIIDRKKTKELIEIKASETFHPRMSKTLDKFLEKGDKGLVIYQGKARQHDPVTVVNYKDYLT